MVLIYLDDLVAMPTTDERGILAVNEIQIKNGAQFYEFYLTPSSQKIETDVDGNTSIKGFGQKISGTFPGTSLEVSEWFYANINQKFIAIQKNCGSHFKIFGSPYNPLFISGNFKDDKDSSLTEITFETVKRSKRPYFIYNYQHSGSDDGGESSGGNSQLLIDHIGL